MLFYQVLIKNILKYDRNVDVELTKNKLEKILIYPVRCLFVDNVEIFEKGTLNITPPPRCCDKMMPWGHTIFRLVKHAYAKNTIQ